MKVSRLINSIVLAVVALLVLIYLAVSVINWNDRLPSAAARRLEKVVLDRPAVADAENVYVYQLGFNAPATADPVEVGARRRVWLETVNKSTDPKTDPLQDGLNFKPDGSTVARLSAPCANDNPDRRACADEFEKLARDWQPTELDELALRRYEALLPLRASREVVPLDLSAPLPGYHHALNAQRLYLLRLGHLAEQGKADEVARGLSADIAFWRAAVPQADTLIPQMIAVAALRNHFFFSTLILRELPPAQIGQAIPPDWSREFSAEERSMLRVMAGELMFQKRVLGDMKKKVRDLRELQAESDSSPTRLRKLQAPLFEPQDTVNVLADEFLRLTEAYAVPMSQYAKVREHWKATCRQARKKVDYYNIVGAIVLGPVECTSYFDYPFRVASVEGLRRAALLTARMHARGLAPEAAAAEVASSDLRDPYTGAPFEWNAERSSVTFDGPEDHSWHRVEFFYQAAAAR